MKYHLAVNIKIVQFISVLLLLGFLTFIGNHAFAQLAPGGTPTEPSGGSGASGFPIDPGAGTGGTGSGASGFPIDPGAGAGDPVGGTGGGPTGPVGGGAGAGGGSGVGAGGAGAGGGSGVGGTGAGAGGGSGACPPAPGTLQNPLSFCTLAEFLLAVLDAVILIVFPFLVLALVYAGFLFVVAQGNEQKLSEARRVFLWTLIGALLVLGAQALAIAINATVQELRAP